MMFLIEYLGGCSRDEGYEACDMQQSPDLDRRDGVGMEAEVMACMNSKDTGHNDIYNLEEGWLYLQFWRCSSK